MEDAAQQRGSALKNHPHPPWRFTPSASSNVRTHDARILCAARTPTSLSEGDQLVKRSAKLLAALAAVLVLLTESVALGAVKPVRAALDPSLVTIHLAERSTHQFTGSVLPEGASQRMVWKSGNTKVAAVSEVGLITARAIGTTTVGVRPASRSNWTKATVRVTDSLAPDTIRLSASRLNLLVGSTGLLTAEAGPDTAITTVRWWSSKTSVALVTPDGQVLARKAGTAVVRAISTRNPALYASALVTVKNLPPPVRLTITPVSAKIERGEKLQLSAAVSPPEANPALRWYTNNPAVATVDKTGLVSAKKVGKFKIKVASRIKPSVDQVRSYEVVDTKTVTGVVIESDESVLLAGGTLQLRASVLPSTASQAVSWTSSNPAVATVSDAGLVTAVSLGSTTVTVAASGKYAQQRVVVMDATPVTELPAQVTNVDGISLNLAKIDAVQRYAVEQVDALRAAGVIDKSETDARKLIIVRAFHMARFPWMSERNVRYWSGDSLYQQNVVYYGIPYTQTNRVYNTSNIVRSGAFKRLGDDAFYTAYMPNRRYPGNDCSSFVSMSYWGLGSRYSYLRSRNMLDASVYKTVAKRSKPTAYLNLRPGDFFVRNGHVAMFLYYANSLRSRVMIIQQGGRNTLNTVGLFLKPISYYSADSRYIARRKRSFA